MGGGCAESLFLTLLQVIHQSPGTVFCEKHLSCEKDAEGQESR
jgi:hypothetical protein